jgi:hypothetical protein
MHRRYLLLLLPLLFLTHCGKSSPGGSGAPVIVPLGLCPTLQWDAPPAANAVSEGHLSFQRCDSKKAVDPEQLGAKVSVVLWMPEHHHGGPKVTVTSDGAGGYRVSKADFFMAGRWEVRIQLLNRAGKLIEQTVLTLTL